MEGRTYAADVMRALADGLFAGQRLLLKHSALVWAARLRYWFSLTDQQRFRAFEAFYVADTSLSRVRFALGQANGDPTGGPRRLTCALEAMDDVDLYGFSSLENFDGQSFRWSSATAAVRLRLGEPAEHVATIQLVGVRLIDPQNELAVFVDARRVTGVKFDRSTWQLTFTVPAAALQKRSEHWLIIHTSTWRHPNLATAEGRRLGLPIASLSFHKKSAATLAAEGTG
jgi:hypothetical protein